MSYILDALKKAEAARNAETSAHLYVPPNFTAPPVSGGAHWDRPWIWAGASACLVAAIGLAWFKPWQTPQAALPPIAQAAKTAPSPPAPITAAIPSAVTAPPSKQANAPEETARKSAPAAPEKPSAEKVAKAPDKPAKKTVEKKASAMSVEGTTPPVKKQRPAPAIKTNDEPVKARSELPSQIQQEIPLFSVNGYLYSGNRADRSVLINNKLTREGEEVAPGLVLEKMMPNEMVLNYKGYRYRTGY